MIEVLSIFYIIVLIFSIVIHEYAHGWMADRLGDPTARYMGRLTLNPVPHIDPIGSVLLPLFLIATSSGFVFGWAKPVPYNPYNLKDQKNGPALVALAGPGVNILIAVIFGMAVKFLVSGGNPGSADMIMFFSIIVLYNTILAVFNLIPVPPLDGSKILFSILPYSMRGAQEFLEKNSFIFIIILIFFGFPVVISITSFLFYLFTGLTL